MDHCGGKATVPAGIVLGLLLGLALFFLRSLSLSFWPPIFLCQNFVTARVFALQKLPHISTTHHPDSLLYRILDHSLEAEIDTSFSVGLICEHSEIK